MHLFLFRSSYIVFSIYIFTFPLWFELSTSTVLFSCHNYLKTSYCLFLYLPVGVGILNILIMKQTFLGSLKSAVALLDFCFNFMQEYFFLLFVSSVFDTSQHFVATRSQLLFGSLRMSLK